MKNMLHILAAIAFLGGIIAPACGFAWGGKFSVIKICTAQGLESKIVTNDSNSDEAPGHQLADQCQFCFTTAHLTSFLPHAIVLERLAYYAEKQQFDLYNIIYLSRLKNSDTARAPPVLV